MGQGGGRAAAVGSQAAAAGDGAPPAGGTDEWTQPDSPPASTAGGRRVPEPPAAQSSAQKTKRGAQYTKGTHRQRGGQAVGQQRHRRHRQRVVEHVPGRDGRQPQQRHQLPALRAAIRLEFFKGAAHEPTPAHACRPAVSVEPHPRPRASSQLPRHGDARARLPAARRTPPAQPGLVPAGMPARPPGRPCRRMRGRPPRSQAPCRWPSTWGTAWSGTAPPARAAGTCGKGGQMLGHILHHPRGRYLGQSALEARRSSGRVAQQRQRVRPAGLSAPLTARPPRPFPIHGTPRKPPHTAIMWCRPLPTPLVSNWHAPACSAARAGPHLPMTKATVCPTLLPTQTSSEP